MRPFHWLTGNVRPGRDAGRYGQQTRWQAASAQVRYPAPRRGYPSASAIVDCGPASLAGCAKKPPPGRCFPHAAALQAARQAMPRWPVHQPCAPPPALPPAADPAPTAPFAGPARSDDPLRSRPTVQARRGRRQDSPPAACPAS